MKQLPFKTFKMAVLILFALYIFFPIYVVLMGSFKTEFGLYADIFGLPKALDFSNYKTALIDGHLKDYVINSVIVTFTSVAVTITLSSMAAFALTRLKLKFSKLIYPFFLIGISIPAQVGIIQLAVMMSRMHLNNSLLGLILVHIAYELPFSIFVFYGFMQSLPWGIQEAAVIDGCSKWQLYWQFCLPLSANAIATVAIFDTVDVWNNMLFSLVLISKESLRTLPYGLLQFRGQYSSQYTVIFAGAVLISLPLTILFILMQEKFMSGITQGAVKG